MKNSNDKKDAALQMLANYHVDMMKNPYSDEEFRHDEDYGLTADKPIMVDHIEGSKEYLKSLRTKSGKPLTWNRVGSVSSKVEEGVVDMYMLYLDGEELTPIYLNMYAFENSNVAPRILTLASVTEETVKVDESLLPGTHKTISDSGKVEDEASHEKVIVRDKKSKNKVLIAVCVILAILCGILAISTASLQAQLTEAGIERDESVGNVRDAYMQYKDMVKYFYLDSAVIVEDNGDKYYHRLGCPNMGDFESFWVYNSENAKANGYKACGTCIEPGFDNYMNNIYDDEWLYE